MWQITDPKIAQYMKPTNPATATIYKISPRQQDRQPGSPQSYTIRFVSSKPLSEAEIARAVKVTAVDDKQKVLQINGKSSYLLRLVPQGLQGSAGDSSTGVIGDDSSSTTSPRNQDIVISKSGMLILSFFRV